MPHVIIANAMESFHDQSLPAIALIQNSFIEQKNFMVWISTFFDPRHVFLIYLPLLFAFSRHVSQKLVITLTIAEWSNQLLKWFLAGERPYWYVHERASQIQDQSSSLLLFNLVMPNHTTTDSGTTTVPLALQQFPVTCELGAGSPSGHAMVTASVWYILIDSLLKGQLIPNNTNISISESSQLRFNTNLTDTIKRNLSSKLGWTFYTIILALVSVSRVFLACHFPHQCIGGAIMGLIIARFVSGMDLSKICCSHYRWGTLLMFSAVMTTYGLLKLIGFDPLWSVDKAMKWCIKPEYIHLDTTPFFSMMRYLGFCLGAGLGLHSMFVAKHHNIELANGHKLTNDGRRYATNTVVISRLIAGCISIVFGRVLLAIPIDKSNLQLFYVMSFVIYVVFAYSAMAPIPYFTHKIINRLVGSSPLISLRHSTITIDKITDDKSQ